MASPLGSDMDIDDSRSDSFEADAGGENKSIAGSCSEGLPLVGESDILVNDGLADLNLEEFSPSKYQREYNFFGTECQKVWVAILRKIDDAGTVMALEQVPQLRALAKERKEELVLLEILTKMELPKPSLLSLRDVNKRFRVLIDECILAGKTTWIEKKYALDKPELIKKNFGIKIPKTSLMMSFLSLLVDSEDMFVSALIFLQQHGASLKSLSFVIAVGDPHIVYHWLSSLLAHLHKVRHLKITFVNAESEARIPQWADPQYNKAILPSLDNLVGLELAFKDRHHLSGRLQNILGQYGHIISKLTIGAGAFQLMSLELCNDKLMNVKEFYLRDLFNGFKTSVFEKLATIQWPQMKKLVLVGNLDSMNSDFIKAIGSFSLSLKILDLANLEIDWRRFSTSGMKMGDWTCFPNIEGFFIRPAKEFHSSPIWGVLQVVFGRLKNLTFLGGWAWKIQDEFISKTPFNEWLIRYFCLFPELQKIRKLGVGPNGSVKQKVWARSNFAG